MKKINRFARHRPVALTAAALLSALLGMLVSACGGGAVGASAGSNTQPPVEVPTAPAETWALVQAAEVGMDAALLAHALSDLPAASEHGMASMLVLRHGKPVLEQYWNGYTKDSLHDLRSATKSITALLVGIALDRQLLASVNEPIRSYLGTAYPSAPALQQNITIDHLLTMRSGLACDDRDSNSPGNEDKMYRSTDWVGFILKLPQQATPGSAAHYCTGGAVTLGRLVAEASKQTVPAFANANLFAPLGITSVRWADFDDHRQTDTGGHLQMRPRDLARLGQLVLQQGKWEGKQVVSSAWIADAIGQHTLIDNGWKYGYLWWMKYLPYQDSTVTLHFAWGNGGQFIYVIPELDLVAVFTGENYNLDKAERPFDILRDYVLPSVKSR